MAMIRSSNEGLLIMPGPRLGYERHVNCNHSHIEGSLSVVFPSSM